MGKLIIDLSLVNKIIQDRNGPTLLRLIAQVVNYDPLTGTLHVVDVPESLTGHASQPTNLEINTNTLLPDIGPTQQDGFMEGAITNIEVAVRRETDELVALDIYEVNDPAIVLSRLGDLQELQSV